MSITPKPTIHHGFPSSATQVFAIKEICHLIIEQLPRRDVVSCLTVSREMWPTAVRVLYREVHVGTASLLGAKKCALTRFVTYCESVRSVILKDTLADLHHVPILDVTSIYPNVTGIKAKFYILYETNLGHGVIGSVIFNGIVENKWSMVELQFDNLFNTQHIDLMDRRLLGPYSNRLHGHLTKLQFGPSNPVCVRYEAPLTIDLLVNDQFSPILSQLRVFRCTTFWVTSQALANLINSAWHLHTVVARMPVSKPPPNLSHLQRLLNKRNIGYMDIRTPGKLGRVLKPSMKSLRVLHIDDSFLLSGDSLDQQVQELGASIYTGKSHCRYPALEELHLWFPSLSSFEQAGCAVSLVHLVGKTCQVHAHYPTTREGFRFGVGERDKDPVVWKQQVTKLNIEIALLRSLVMPEAGWKQLKNASVASVDERGETIRQPVCVVGGVGYDVLRVNGVCIPKFTKDDQDTWVAKEE